MSDPVCNAWADGNALVLVRRGPDGARRTERLRGEHSFFVRKGAIPEDLDRMLRSSRSVLSMKDEGSWTRICWADRWARMAMIRGRKDDRGQVMQSPFQQRGIEVFEGDVDPVRRYFTDAGVTIAKPRRFYYDIETDSRVPIVAAKRGEARVLCWALVDESKALVASGMLEADTDDAERKLLEGFFDAVEAAQVDQLVGWSSDDFDEPVIKSRASRLNARGDFQGVLWLDHLKVYRRMNLNSAESGAEKQSMKLQSIAMATVGEGKEEVPPEVAARWPGQSLGALSWQLWEAGGWFRDLLGRYNVKDTVLLPAIEGATGFLALFDTLADVCRVLPDSRGLLPTQQMDGFMLRLGAEHDHRFPTREWGEEKESNPFEGAYVMEPKKRGILRDVHVADFASLYPSIILTWNMSPETKAVKCPVNGPIPPGHCRSPKTGIGFRTDVEGILPIALRAMIRLRKEWSDKASKLPPGTPEAKEAQRRSMAYKVAANSFYGVVGSPFSRYFDRDLARSVTQNGVWLIMETIHAAETRGFEVVYGDTDSFFAMKASQTDMESFVDWCNADLYPRLLEKMGCAPEHRAIKLAYEKAFDRVVMVCAKRYFGTFLHYKGTAAKPVPREGEEFDKKLHSKPEIKGLEYKRGDASVLARGLQEKVIMDLVRGIDRAEVFRGHLERMLAHVTVEDLPLEEVAISKSLSKKVDDYKRKTPTGKDAALPPHVRVAEQLIAAGKSLGEGSRVSYVVVDGSDGIKAIPAEEYRGELDRFYLWESTIFPPTQRVLQAAFPDQDWVTGLERIRPTKRQAKAMAAGQADLFDAGPRIVRAKAGATAQPSLFERMGGIPLEDPVPDTEEEAARHLHRLAEENLLRDLEAERWRG